MLFTKSARVAASKAFIASIIVLVSSGIIAPAAQAAEEASEVKPITFGLDYKLDLFGAVSGQASKRGRHLDALTLSADVDLEQVVGWRGASAHVDIVNTSGNAPNDDVGILQGLDNIEVEAQRLRLFQAWIEQGFADGRASVRAGAYDIGGEFGVLESGADLIGPSFGMAPELAGAGPNGASAYPSTAVGVRLAVQPTKTAYGMLAVVGAKPGSVGDEGGVDTDFDDGAMVIAEGGWTGRGKLGVGGWAFTERAEIENAAGDTERKRAWGVYALAEQPLSERATAFLRVGVSDGETQGLDGSWQAGVRAQAFASRPDSVLAFGVTQARVSDIYREIYRDLGGNPARDETVVELTYADIFAGKVRIQPDLQYIRRPGADRDREDEVVAGVRLQVTF